MVKPPAPVSGNLLSYFIYVFSKVLTKSDYFFIKYSQIDLSNWSTVCCLWGTNWSMYVLWINFSFSCFHWTFFY